MFGIIFLGYHNGRRLVPKVLQRDFANKTSDYIDKIYLFYTIRNLYDGGNAYAHHRRPDCCYQLMYNMLQSWLFGWSQ